MVDYVILVRETEQSSADPRRGRRRGRRPGVRRGQDQDIQPRVELRRRRPRTQHSYRRGRLLRRSQGGHAQPDHEDTLDSGQGEGRRAPDHSCQSHRRQSYQCAAFGGHEAVSCEPRQGGGRTPRADRGFRNRPQGSSGEGSQRRRVRGGGGHVQAEHARGSLRQVPRRDRPRHPDTGEGLSFSARTTSRTGPKKRATSRSS